MKKRLLLVELNEVNFDVVKKYVADEPHLFPTFQKILSWENRKTSSEAEYDHLEPWIQWVSAHTGQTYQQHGVFRLGDMVRSDHLQIFERVESAGFSVGAISPMNAKNNLAHPKYFIPDPWTETPPDNSWWSINLSTALSQAVNDNASARLSFSTLVILLMAVIKFAKYAITQNMWLLLSGLYQNHGTKRCSWTCSWRICILICRARKIPTLP